MNELPVGHTRKQSVTEAMTTAARCVCMCTRTHTQCLMGKGGVEFPVGRGNRGDRWTKITFRLHGRMEHCASAPGRRSCFAATAARRRRRFFFRTGKYRHVFCCLCLFRHSYARVDLGAFPQCCFLSGARCATSHAM